MAKKQTRRSISVSRATYERLKMFCETNSISMSQFVETRVGDYLSTDPSAPSSDRAGEQRVIATVTNTAAPAAKPAPVRSAPAAAPAHTQATPVRPVPAQAPAAPRQAVPMTSAAARFAVEPPPPIIKQKAETAAPKPVEKRADQIFTF